MAPLLCPVVLGRDEELRLLTAAVDDVATGHGQAIVLAGEPGIGKSRLARECAAVATQRGMPVLTGRAVAGPSPIAYRPISESLASAARAGLVIEGDLPARSDNPLEMGEAFLRLLREVSGGTGCLLLLDDLHWADPETLALLDYVAPHLTDEPLLVVATARLDGSVGATAVLALAERRTATIIELDALSGADVAAMVAACTHGVADSALVDSAKEFGEGVPFLIEELVAAWPRRLPRTFAASVRERLDALAPDQRRALEVGAVLGRDIDWQLVSAATGVSAEVVAGAIERGVAAHLVSADGGDVRFRHALTRDAIVDGLLPPTRATMAADALRAVETAHPGLPGPWCELGVGLAQTAGLASRAGDLLWVLARRALERGELASAERALRSARPLVDDAGREYDIDDLLVGVLALAGKHADAVDVGAQLLRGAPPDGDVSRRRGVHLRMARAAVAGQKWDDAATHLDAAERATVRLQEIGVAAEIDALLSHVAIGGGDVEAAGQLAQRAVDGALSAGAIEVACEALEVLGRSLRLRDLDDAEAAFARSFALADAAGLELWAVRALHEWGTIEFFRAGGVTRLEEARARAAEAGAVVTTAMIDLQLGAGYNAALELDRSLAAAERCQVACRRFGLDLVEALSIQLEAAAYALRGDFPAMYAALGRAPSDNAEVTASNEGNVLAVAALVADDVARARQHLERSMTCRRAIRVPAPAPAPGMWVLLLAVDGEADIAAAVDEVVESGATVNRINRGFVGLAEAIALGRRGETDVATARAETALADLATAPWHANIGRRFVAEAALGDKWGTPVEWLTDAAAFFRSVGHEALASAAEALLRGRPQVPDALRALGITAREAEVLALVADGDSTRDIAARLYISPRTVEKHIESLQRKTGHHTRARLVAFAAASR